jgi:hypothetical protein
MTDTALDGFRHRDLARLARVAQALRGGHIIELPAHPTQRGTMIERFRVAPDRINEIPSLVHNVTMTSRHNVSTSLFEPLDWSLQAFLEMIAWWPSATLDGLAPTRPDDTDSAQVFLRRLDQTGRAALNGLALTLTPHGASEDEPWTVTITPEHGDGKWIADDLVTAP